MIRVCPECDKAFFIGEFDYCPPCPKCGYVLIEQREDGRMEMESDIVFTVEEEERLAKVMNISSDGVRIAYKGEGIPIDTIMDFNLERLNIHRPALAVWTKQLSSKVSESGMRFL